MAEDVTLTRDEALTILAALDAASTLASSASDIETELEVVQAHGILIERLFGDLPDEGDG